jgi:DNA-binding XRE family transcriptional regulator
MKNPTSTNRLSEFRARAGLSRSQLGRRAELEGQTIYRIENGSGTRLETAQRLAKALSEALDEEISVEDLFPQLEVSA